MTIIERIQNLRNRFTQNKGDERDVAQIDGWMQEAKRLFLLKSLKDHDGIKYVFEVFEGEISKINEALKKSYSKELRTKKGTFYSIAAISRRNMSIFLGVLTNNLTSSRSL